MSDYIRTIRAEDAVGTVLAHDITRIVPGVSKGVGFKKGHIVRAEDVAELLKVGKKHLFILELPPDKLHENDAARRIARAVADPALQLKGPHEGKISIISPCDGLVKINTAGLLAINRLDGIVLSTLRTNFRCNREQVVAGTRILPLVINAAAIEEVEAIAEAHRPVIQVKPFRRLRVGAVVTGSEVYEGLVKDGFDRHVGRKITAMGSVLVRKILVPDDTRRIAAAIRELMDEQCGLILTTGGLSVDPDDVTRLGVREAGFKIEFYGSPVLPGAMFLFARHGRTPLLGLPACVFYHETTLFDIMLSRVLADDPVTKNDIAAMGHGGLCLQCDVCHYPVCPFG
jgi:Probable molybdopterin binding domain